jgi:RNA 2',3'-cyclic 3'-phosphodiesterase
MRLFFAVEPDAGARRAAAALVAPLRARTGARSVRWVREENLHVTLRFLGDVEPTRVPELAAAVTAALAPLAPFALRLGPPRAFPTRRPRLVVLDVEPPEPLAALAAAVERGVVAAGFPPEPRPFRAHLTLGRVKGPGRAPRDLDVTVPDTAPGQTFDVTEAVLFRSELHRDGARYTPLERIPLGALGGSSHP